MAKATTDGIELPKPVVISYLDSVKLTEANIDNYNWNHRKPNNLGQRPPKITPAAKATYGIIISLVEKEAEKVRRNSPESYQLIWSEHCTGVPVSFSYGQIIKLGYQMEFADDKTKANKKKTIKNYIDRLQDAGFLLSHDDGHRGTIRATVNKDWLAFSQQFEQANYMVSAAKSPKKLNIENQALREGERKNFPPSSKVISSSREKREVIDGVRASQPVQLSIESKNLKRSPVVTSKDSAASQAPPPPNSDFPQKNSPPAAAVTRYDFGDSKPNAVIIAAAAAMKWNILTDVDFFERENSRTLRDLLTGIVHREVKTMKTPNYKEVLRKLLLSIAHVAEQERSGKFERQLLWRNYLSTDTQKFRRGGTFVTVLGNTYTKYVSSLAVPYSYEADQRPEVNKLMRLQEMNQLLHKMAGTIANLIIPANGVGTVEIEQVTRLRQKLTSEMGKKCKGYHLDQATTNEFLRKIVTMTTIFDPNQE